MGNVWVKIGVVALVFVVLLVVILVAGGGGGPTTTGVAPAVGGASLGQESAAAIGMESDSETDQVRTLVAEVAAIEARFSELEEANERLTARNRDLEDIKGAVVREVTGEIEGVLEGLQESVEARNEEADERLGSLFEQFRGRMGQAVQVGEEVSRPLFLGADSKAGVGTVWIEPEGMGEDGEGLFAGVPRTLLGGVVEEADRDAAAALAVRPVYTVAKNATLVGVTAFTALIGRVPVGEESRVTDPYFFKVLLGRENLAANGHEIPGVEYAVASGTAVGDWTLSCVAGDVTSITFAFEDGRIVTIPEARDVSTGSGSATTRVRLGGLSDDYGNPCVLGDKISNASRHLAQSAGVLTLGAAADAIAAAETTRTAGYLTGGQTVVTGDIARYAAGRGLAGTAQEIARWIRDRQAQEYDVIYVAPGARVAVHVDEELRIDYAPEGRMVNYGDARSVAYRALD